MFKALSIIIFFLSLCQISYSKDFLYNGIKFNCTQVNDSCVQIKSWRTGLKSIVVPAAVTDNKGKKYKVISIDTYMSGYNYLAETVVIENGVESIEPRCFNCFHKLDSVVLPNTLKKIGAKAFDNYSNFKRMVVPTEQVRSLLIESGIPSKVLPEVDNGEGANNNKEELKRLEAILKQREEEIENEKRKTEEAQKKVSIALKEAEEAKLRADNALRQAEDAQKKSDDIEQELIKSRNKETVSQNATIEEMRKTYKEAMSQVDEMIKSNIELKASYTAIKKSNTELTRLNKELMQSNSDLRTQFILADSIKKAKENEIMQIKQNIAQLSIAKLKAVRLVRTGFVSSKNDQRFDQNDNVCAVLKVSVAKFEPKYASDHMFDFPGYIRYKEPGGFDWIFMAEGAKSIRLYSENKEFESKTIEFKDINPEIPSLESACVYELEITVE